MPKTHVYCSKGQWAKGKMQPFMVSIGLWAKVHNIRSHYDKDAKMHKLFLNSQRAVLFRKHLTLSKANVDKNILVFIRDTGIGLYRLL